jgi:hypothetical protein
MHLSFKPDARAATSAREEIGLAIADSLLVRVSTDQG